MDHHSHNLTSYAYDIPGWRISGIQPEQSYVAINATMSPTAAPEEVRAMLRQLLIDRFKLVVHTKREERAGYALVIAKGGPKLRAVAKDGTVPPLPDYMGPQPAAPYEGRLFTSLEGIGVLAVTGRGVTLSQLADELSKELRLPIFE
jgi:uncharacterized protein (TIGR03435 family)